MEPGEELLACTGDNFWLEFRGSRLTSEAWDRTRNLARRIIEIKSASAERLELIVERFGKREVRLFLLDLVRRTGAETGSRSGRPVFREHFRLFYLGSFQNGNWWN